MVKIKSLSLKKSKENIKQTGIYFGAVLMMSGFISCGGETEYESKVVLSPTQGIITEVKEQQQDLFRITDEQVVDSPDKSRIIAEYMDGGRDTFTLAEAKLMEAENPRRFGSMNGILMGGMMGYMMGKSMSTPVNRNAYANSSAYQKSTTSNSAFKSSAKRTTVKSPKSGFGSSKSTRSSGG